MSGTRTELATLGGGCYWCLEAIYEQINGVTRLKRGDKVQFGQTVAEVVK